MSPTTAAWPSQTATIKYPAEHNPAPTLGTDDTPHLAQGATDATRSDPPPSHPVPAPLLIPIRGDHRRPDTDPCTYLG